MIYAYAICFMWMIGFMVVFLNDQSVYFRKSSRTTSRVLEATICLTPLATAILFHVTQQPLVGVLPVIAIVGLLIGAIDISITESRLRNLYDRERYSLERQIEDLEWDLSVGLDKVEQLEAYENLTRARKELSLLKKRYETY